MTDKEKIRAEVERLRKSYQIMYQELDCESPELMSVCAKRNLCQDILIFIDSLQEEPKPKFHIGDTIRHKEEKDSFKVFAIEDDCYKLENNIVVSIAAQDHWKLVEEPTSHYPKAKEASGTLKKMLDNITEESLAKARKQLEEEPATSIWHNPKEMPPDDIIVFRYIDGLTTCRYVGQTMKGVLAWAYFNELKKL